MPLYDQYLAKSFRQVIELAFWCYALEKIWGSLEGLLTLSKLVRSSKIAAKYWLVVCKKTLSIIIMSVLPIFSTVALILQIFT